MTVGVPAAVAIGAGFLDSPHIGDVQDRLGNAVLVMLHWNLIIPQEEARNTGDVLPHDLQIRHYWIGTLGEIRESLDPEVTIVDLFEHPTISGFAGFIRSRREAGSSEPAARPSVERVQRGQQRLQRQRSLRRVRTMSSQPEVDRGGER